VVAAGGVTVLAAFGVRDTGGDAAQTVTRSAVSSSTPSAVSPTPAARVVTVKPRPRGYAGSTFTTTLRSGANGPIVAKIQQRLAWTGLAVKVTGTYDAATVHVVKLFQSKQLLYATGRVDKRTYARLVQVTRRGAQLDPRCSGAARVLCIDKSQKVLRYLVNGKVVLVLDARFGSPWLPTREGVFSVYLKSRYQVSTIYHTPMPFAMFFSGGQAVHYSMYFHAVGYAGASHGCVNIRNITAMAWLFDHTPLGTKVVIYRTSLVG
jgi:lipoprotein-anchoring transpeptidase ErfK/SrfK